MSTYIQRTVNSDWKFVPITYDEIDNPVLKKRLTDVHDRKIQRFREMHRMMEKLNNADSSSEDDEESESESESEDEDEPRNIAENDHYFTDDEWVDPREKFDNHLHCIDFNIAKSILGKKVMCFIGQGNPIRAGLQPHTFTHIVRELESNESDIPADYVESTAESYVYIDEPLEDDQKHMYLLENDECPYIYTHGKDGYFCTGSGSDEVYILGKWVRT